jgi:hypothetical protein
LLHFLSDTFACWRLGPSFWWWCSFARRTAGLLWKLERAFVFRLDSLLYPGTLPFCKTLEVDKALTKNVEAFKQEALARVHSPKYCSDPKNQAQALTSGVSKAHFLFRVAVVVVLELGSN